MEKQSKAKNQKFSNFIKKNLYLILMIACVIAIATMVAVTYALKQKGEVNAVNVAGKEEPQEQTETPDPTEQTGTE